MGMGGGDVSYGRGLRSSSHLHCAAVNMGDCVCPRPQRPHRSGKSIGCSSVGSCEAILPSSALAGADIGGRVVTAAGTTTGSRSGADSAGDVAVDRGVGSIISNRAKERWQVPQTCGPGLSVLDEENWLVSSCWECLWALEWSVCTVEGRIGGRSGRAEETWVAVPATAWPGLNPAWGGETWRSDGRKFELTRSALPERAGGSRPPSAPSKFPGFPVPAKSWPSPLGQPALPGSAPTT
ncbi:hypothetical protein BKA59DRAFT_461359 [Fusarium tricinctum]|uniref:Uncharacterized protein n=1 Tax=Fusarium tricinctum TaxID=61284 RepID=A0A8K0W527_9HYPO|nr:hypothetical protein BKA59DRAFT_461359 [Fusarium tricinctum]